MQATLPFDTAKARLLLTTVQNNLLGKCGSC